MAATATIRLNGGLGLDLMSGGNGNDRFVFNTALTANKDTLLDFNKFGNDAFFLDNAIFSKLASVRRRRRISTSAPAADADDFIVYNQADRRAVLRYRRQRCRRRLPCSLSLTNRPALTISRFPSSI